MMSEQRVNAEATESANEQVAGWTVGEAVFAAIVVLGALWRLVSLADLPLSAAEATEALAVVGFWSAAAPYTVGSPAWFTLTALLRPVIGISDSAMRFVPALFGAATLTLPWFLRHRIGMIGAIIASGLLAASPVFTMLSRTAGGDAIAVFAALLLFVAWVNYRDFGTRRPFLTGCAALAIGLLSSSLFYTFLVALLAVLLLARVATPVTDNDRTITPAWWREGAITVAVVTVAVGTMLLVVPAGLGAMGQQFAHWVAQFGIGRELAYPLQALLYEAPLLIFGLVALVFALWKGAATGSWLTWWLLLGLLVVIVQSGVVANIAVVILPLYLMVGWLFNYLFSAVTQPAHDGRSGWQLWLVTTMVFAWGVLALVNVGRYTRVSAVNFAPLIVTLLFFLLISLITFAIVTNILQGVQGSALGLLLVCIFFGMGTSWTLAHDTGNHPREAWVSAGTDHDVRLLRTTLHEASYQLVRDADELAIVSLIDTPVLRWYLRDFDTVSFTDAIVPGLTETAVIAPESAEPPLGTGYASATFDIMQTSAESAEAFDLTRELQWRFFQQDDRPILRDRATIWLDIVDEGDNN